MSQTTDQSSTGHTERPLGVAILNSARKWIGEAAHSLALAQALAEDGHRVILVVRRGFELEQRAREAGLRVEALHMGSRFHPLRDLRDCLAIRRLAREERLDILHANRGKDHWLAAFARIYMKRRPAIVRTRHVVTGAHGHLFNRWLYRHGSDALTAVSRAAMDSLGSLAEGVDPARRRVILSAVDAQRFSPERRCDALRREMGVGEGELLVGLVGRYQRVKGQRYFLAAAARLLDMGLPCRFCLAGRATDRQLRNLEALALEAGVPRDRFTVLGWVDDLPALIALFDIGAIASVGSEGSSRVALEMLASALPIVATRVGGIPKSSKTGARGGSWRPAMAKPWQRPSPIWRATPPGARPWPGRLEASPRPVSAADGGWTRWSTPTEASNPVDTCPFSWTAVNCRSRYRETATHASGSCPVRFCSFHPELGETGSSGGPKRLYPSSVQGNGHSAGASPADASHPAESRAIDI